MALNKNEKENILKATKLLYRPEYKNKEISENTKGEPTGVIFLPRRKQDWKGITPTEILENMDIKNMDEKLLKKLAEQVFSFIKDYPELMRELKEKYFKDL